MSDERNRDKVTHIDWTNVDSPEYRVIIRDDTINKIIIKDRVKDTKYELNWNKLNPKHIYRYRVQVYQDGKWENTTPYRPLNPPMTLIKSIYEPPRKSIVSDSQAKLYFLFTVDTEVNIRLMRKPDLSKGVDDQIFCRINGKEYGINYIMDLLDAFKMKGTFFIDILMEYQFGRESLELVIDAIKKRGHDTQLHVHPDPNLLFTHDQRLHKLFLALKGNDTDQFKRVLELSMKLFEDRVGNTPIAYRSGAYDLCNEFLSVLPKFGLRFDSSLYAFKNCRVSPWMRTRTQPFQFEDIIEIPVSWMIYERLNKTAFAHQFLPRNSEASTHSAMTKLANISSYKNPLFLVYMMHSFTLLKRQSANDVKLLQKWNKELRLTCPKSAYERLLRTKESPFQYYQGFDSNRASTLARTLGIISSLPGVKPITFSELNKMNLEHLLNTTTPVDPVSVWQESTQQTKVTRTRKYSLSFLEHLERRTYLWDR